MDESTGIQVDGHLDRRAFRSTGIREHRRAESEESKKRRGEEEGEERKVQEASDT